MYAAEERGREKMEEGRGERRICVELVLT